MNGSEWKVKECEEGKLAEGRGGWERTARRRFDAGFLDGGGGVAAAPVVVVLLLCCAAREEPDGGDGGGQSGVSSI